MLIAGYLLVIMELLTQLHRDAELVFHTNCRNSALTNLAFSEMSYFVHALFMYIAILSVGTKILAETVLRYTS